MIIRCLLFVCLGCLSLSSKAQERFFKFLSGWANYSLLEQKNNTFISIGSAIDTSTSWNKITFSQINYKGDSIDTYFFKIDSAFSTEIDLNTVTNKFNQNYVGGALAVADTGNSYTLIPFIAKFNKEFRDTFYFKKLKLGDEGRIIIIRQSNDTSLVLGADFNIFPISGINIKSMLMSMDTLGNIRWQKEFSCGGNCQMNPIAITINPDKSILYLNNEIYWHSPDVENVVPLLIKTDEFGNKLWQISFESSLTKNYGGGVLPTDDGNYLAVWYDAFMAGYKGGINPKASIWMTKISQGGDTLWQKNLSEGIARFGIHELFYMVSNVEKLPDGNIILAGYTSDTSYNHGFLIKIDQEANIKWMRLYRVLEDVNDAFSGPKIYGVTQTSDGGFICPGEYFSFPSSYFPNGKQSAFALKVDEYGCLYPNCQLNDGVPQDLPLSGMAIFPNPVDKVASISLALPASNQKRWIILDDITGRELLRQQLLNEEQSIDVSHLEQGMYLLQLWEGNKQIAVTKLMVQH